MSEEPRCAYCRRRPVDARWRPFCGERCKMADLGRWLSGDYRIASARSASPHDAGPLEDPDQPHERHER